MAESKIKAVNKKDAEVIIMDNSNFKKIEFYARSTGYMRLRVTMSDGTYKYVDMGNLIG